MLIVLGERVEAGEECDHTEDFFFLRDVRRVTLLFDSMGEMGFLTSRSPGSSFDRGLRPEASIVFD